MKLYVILLLVIAICVIGCGNENGKTQNDSQIVEEMNTEVDEFSKLLAEQRIWIKEKEKSVEEAGKEVEGGSIYSCINLINLIYGE